MYFILTVFILTRFHCNPTRSPPVAILPTLMLDPHFQPHTASWFWQSFLFSFVEYSMSLQQCLEDLQLLWLSWYDFLYCIAQHVRRSVMTSIKIITMNDSLVSILHSHIYTHSHNSHTPNPCLQSGKLLESWVMQHSTSPLRTLCIL